MHQRLAVYQRVAAIEDAAAVATMQEELRDRYGPVPPAVENLLYVALARNVARRARVESVMTTATTFHIKVRHGVTDTQRARVEGLGQRGVRVGPEQVRIDRVEAGEGWMPLLVKILRAMEVRPAG
jgi:transcription-repair coupling factor (superfamily II helicase)